jgi:hypothetical protein
VKAIAGIAIVALHALGFAVLAPECRRSELVVELAPDGPRARGADAVTHDAFYTRWTAHYRGAPPRSVGLAAITGPRQDPAARACTGRVVVGQRMLDQIGGEVARVLAEELRGEAIVGVGAFVRVDRFALRWAQLLAHPEDLFTVRAAPHGYVRATGALVFERATIPLLVALVPRPEPGARELAFTIVARADLAFDSSIVQWLSDKLGGDRLATRLARRHIDEALITALAPPPPFDLPGGQQLAFAYCDGPPEITNDGYGALPVAVVLGASREPPPRRGPAPRAPIPAGTVLAIDLDLDALDAILHELWRTGFLDRQLAPLAERFNADPTIASLLTLRIDPPRLALPPVTGVSPGGLALHADARVALHDGARTTTGRIWGGLAFRFTGDQLSVDLGALELTCERTPTTLVPCYGDLVAAMRDRGDQFHGELTRIFTGVLRELFVDRRLTISGLPAAIVIQSARPTVTASATNGSLRLDLAASLATAP